MARGRHKRSRRKHKQIDPVAVIRGKTSVTCAELITLIREVNPTDRDLPSREEQWRYQQKSDLQSLLINRFAQEVEVIADEGELVLLRHRPSGRDACHALISELDEEATRWVRRQLDEQAAEALLPKGGEHRPAVSVASSPGPEDLDVPEADAEGAEDLLERGIAAREQYDYDEARSLLKQAVTASRGALEPALALLEFLVDHLAAYKDALLVEPRLQPVAAADDRVRVLLALAAARGGAPDRAQEFIAGVDHPSVAEVLVILAEAALRSGDEASALGHMADAEARGAQAHEVHRLKQEVEKYREQRWLAEEDAAAEALEGGNLEEAERRARNVLDHWAGSARARGVLREINRQRRDLATAEVLQRAENFRRCKDFAVAAELYGEALKLGADPAMVGPLMDGARDHVQRAADEKAVEDAVMLLGGGEPRLGLVAFRSLTDVLQARVRERCPLPLLDLMEEVSPRAAPEAVVDAVLALDAAGHLLDEGDAGGALDLLSPHERVLRGSGHFRRIMARTNRIVDRQRRQHAQAQLRVAQTAFDAEDIPHALELCKALDLRSLPEEDRQRAEALTKRAKIALEDRDAVERFQQLAETSHTLMEARDLAHHLANSGHSAYRGDWIDRESQAVKELRRIGQIQQIGDSGTDDLRDMNAADLVGQSNMALLPGGGHLLLPMVKGLLLVLREIELGSGHVRRARTLNLRDVLEPPFSLSTDGKLVQITSGDLNVRRFSWPDIDLQRGGRPLDLIPGLKMGRLTTLGGTHTMWIVNRPPDAKDYTVYVVDLNGWRLWRTLENFSGCAHVAGGSDEAFVVGIRRRGEGQLFRVDGTVNPALTFPKVSVRAAAISPDGDGVLLVHQRFLPSIEGGKAQRGPLEVAWFLPSGKQGRCLVLDDADRAFPPGIATAKELGLCFMIVGNLTDGRDLLALQTTNAGVDLVYRAPVPNPTLLVHDTDSRRVAVIASGDCGIRVVPLGGAPPDLCAEVQPPPTFPRFSRPLGCIEEPAELEPGTRSLVSRVRDMSDTEAESWYEGLCVECQSDYQAWGEYIEVLLMTGPVSQSQGTMRPQWHRNLHHPLCRFRYANMLVDVDGWEELFELLADLDVQGLDPVFRQHRHHLLGMALMKTGKMTDALQAFERGLAVSGGKCVGLEAHADLARILTGNDIRYGSRGIKELVSSIIKADDLLDRDDVEGALAAIDRPEIWRYKELQSFARLAVCHLRRTCPPAERLRKIIALINFQHINEEALWDYGGANNLPLLEHTWGEDDLEVLDDKVFDELEGEWDMKPVVLVLQDLLQKADK